MAKEEESKRELQAVQAELIKAEVQKKHRSLSLSFGLGAPPPVARSYIARRHCREFANCGIVRLGKPIAPHLVETKLRRLLSVI